MRTIFLYEWKLKHNAIEAARNINFAFGERSANERTIRRWFEKFQNCEQTRVNFARGDPRSSLIMTIYESSLHKIQVYQFDHLEKR